LAVGSLVPSTAWVAKPVGQAARDEASAEPEPSTTIAGPDHPSGAVATHSNPAWQSGSAQSMSPLQLSSVPFVQSSVPVQPSSVPPSELVTMPPSESESESEPELEPEPELPNPDPPEPELPEPALPEPEPPEPELPGPELDPELASVASTLPSAGSRQVAVCSHVVFAQPGAVHPPHAHDSKRNDAALRPRPNFRIAIRSPRSR
jgi:hypothetical protein